jgi:hypothetical protein
MGGNGNAGKHATMEAMKPGSEMVEGPFEPSGNLFTSTLKSSAPFPASALPRTVLNGCRCDAARLPAGALLLKKPLQYSYPLRDRSPARTFRDSTPKGRRNLATLRGVNSYSAQGDSSSALSFSSKLAVSSFSCPSGHTALMSVSNFSGRLSSASSPALAPLKVTAHFCSLGQPVGGGYRADGEQQKQRQF